MHGVWYNFGDIGEACELVYVFLHGSISTQYVHGCLKYYSDDCKLGH